MAKQWYCKIMGSEIGPVTSQQLVDMARTGQLQPDHLIRQADANHWSTADKVRGLFQNAALPPANDSNQHTVQITGPASYTAGNLTSGEKILYAASIHPMIFLSSGILFALFLVGCGMLLSDSLMPFGIVLITVGLMFSLSFAVDDLIIFLTTECVLTDRRVIGKVGFIRRQSLELLLTKVEGLQVAQGIFGRIFDYGTVTVSGTGGSKTPFHGIAKPLDFRKQVQQQITVAQS
jgi:hypothetical protein